MKPRFCTICLVCGCAVAAIHAAPTSDSSQDAKTASPFTWGPLVARPHATYSWMRSEGLLISPGHPTNADVQTVSPGIGLEIGEHWSADYSALWTYYSTRALSNSVGQSATLNGAFTVADWSAAVVQSYTDSSSVLLETGQQTVQHAYTSSLETNHSFDSHTQLALRFEQNVMLAEHFVGSRMWSTTALLHYSFTDSFDVGAGTTISYTAVKKSSDAIGLTPMVELNWRVGKKITLGAKVGVQRQDFLGHHAGTITNPVFAVSARRNFGSTTTLSIAATRATSQSFFSHEATKTSSGSVGLQQRLLHHFQLVVTAEQLDADYLGTEASTPVRRRDRSQSYSVGLSTTLLRRGTLGLTYSHVHNHSSQTGFSVSSRQFGVNVGFSF